MRRLGVFIILVVFLHLGFASCTQNQGANSETENISLDELKTESVHTRGRLSEGEVFQALSRIVRTKLEDDGAESVETYEIEYADSELRTTIVHRDSNRKTHRADAFFNIDGTLSFVRMRDASGSTKTVHFVYDSNGNPVERIESVDDVPLEKLEYNYDDSKDHRLGLKLYEWSEGRWKPVNGRTLAIYVNSANFPTAFEVQSEEGKRNAVFEYERNGNALDNYVDTTFSEEGAESANSGFVSYRDGRPEGMTVRSDDQPEQELRIVAKWKGDTLGDSESLVAESLKRCVSSSCEDVEDRSFTYELRDTEPQLPPASIVVPFLELGSSLIFIEKPEILLGKDGIGFPSWIGL